MSPASTGNAARWLAGREKKGRGEREREREQERERARKRESKKEREREREKKKKKRREREREEEEEGGSRNQAGWSAGLADLFKVSQVAAQFLFFLHHEGLLPHVDKLLPIVAVRRPAVRRHDLLDLQVVALVQQQRSLGMQHPILGQHQRRHMRPLEPRFQSVPLFLVRQPNCELHRQVCAELFQNLGFDVGGFVDFPRLQQATGTSLSTRA